jgi:hypothetical protein
MKLEIPHELKLADAKARMKSLGEYWETKYGVKPTWTKEGGKVVGSIMGFKFDAELTIAKDQVTLEGPEPNFLVRKKVIGYLEHKLTEYLDSEVTLKELEKKAAEKD